MDSFTNAWKIRDPELFLLRLATSLTNTRVKELVPAARLGPRILNAGISEQLTRFVHANPFLSVIEERQTFAGWFEAVGLRTQPSPVKGQTEIFSPIWMLSAVALVDACARLGCRELVDIGSGDGRIPYVAAALGLGGFGVEVNPALVQTQKEIVKTTGVFFESIEADATRFTDYAVFDLEAPLFSIAAYNLDLKERVLANLKPDLVERSRVCFLTGLIDQSLPDWNTEFSFRLPTYWSGSQLFKILSPVGHR